MSPQKAILASLAVASIIGVVAIGVFSVNGSNSGATSEDGAQVATQVATESSQEEEEAGSSVSHRESAAAVDGNRAQSDLPLHFKALKACMLSVQEAVNMTSQMEACQSFPEGDPAAIACWERTRNFDEKIEAALRRSKECPTDDLAVLENDFFVQMRDSAKSGDADAQLCYLATELELNRRWSDAEIAEYKELAPGFVDKALRRGDWRAVKLMMTSERVLAHTEGPLSYLIDNDPVSAYRFNRLARLGATGEYADDLDILASESKKMLPSGAEIESDRWAERMYNDHFRQSPPIDRASEVCEI